MPVVVAVGSATTAGDIKDLQANNFNFTPLTKQTKIIPTFYNYIIRLQRRLNLLRTNIYNRRLFILRICTE